MKKTNEPLKRNESIAWKDLGDHIIILDSGKNKMVHHLEDVSAFIWKNLDGSHDLDSLSKLISQEFDTDSSDAKGDLINFIEQLNHNQLMS